MFAHLRTCADMHVYICMQWDLYIISRTISELQNSLLYRGFYYSEVILNTTVYQDPQKQSVIYREVIVI